METTYFLLQHFPDPFRHEAQNVGLIIQNGEVAARFMGEKAGGRFDKRYVKGVGDADVYQQWVEFWRWELEHETDCMESIEKASGANYRLLRAGSVNVENGESADDVLNRLYPLLVGEHERETASSGLTGQVEHAFKLLGILSTNGRKVLGMRHPVFQGKRVNGIDIPYRPSFMQEGNKLSIMEVVDLASPKVIMHAGYTVHMFDSVRSGNSTRNVEPIAIVQRGEAAESALQAETLLRNAGSIIVDWSNSDQRASFLVERESIAKS